MIYSFPLCELSRGRWFGVGEGMQGVAVVVAVEWVATIILNNAAAIKFCRVARLTGSRPPHAGDALFRASSGVEARGWHSYILLPSPSSSLSFSLPFIFLPITHVISSILFYCCFCSSFLSLTFFLFVFLSPSCDFPFQFLPLLSPSSLSFFAYSSFVRLSSFLRT